jgi:hypothetical protein
MAALPSLLCKPLAGRFHLAALALLFLSACSGVHVAPEATDAFEATNYTRYAWRSEAPSQTGFSRDLLIQKSPSIRAGVEEKMAQLGYTHVEGSEAEFLIEYTAAPGMTEGQRARGSANETLYGSSVNREIDGASSDNAIALSGAVDTGEIMLVFIDATTSAVLWRVAITMVVHDTNRVDPNEVKRAVAKGLTALPPAS